MEELTLGFSPCPNDTFIFDALIHDKIDTEGLRFHVEYHDVETLNEKAFRADLDITTLSYHAFAYATEDYELLDAGSALGFWRGAAAYCKDADLAAALAAMPARSCRRVPKPTFRHSRKIYYRQLLVGSGFSQLTNKQRCCFLILSRL